MSSLSVQVESARVVRRRRASVQSVVRWLHLYVSLIGFLAMLFFAITGITLNHPTWFGEASRTTTQQGQVPLEWVAADAAVVTRLAKTSDEPSDETSEPAPEQLDKLRIVEYLRAEHQLRGIVREFLVDDEECSIAMAGPGYSADTLIDREAGTLEITIVEHGTIAMWNDLHKGRDTGKAWSWAIDLSAAVMIVSCLTGLAMLFFMKRKRWSGSVWAAVGATLFVAVIRFWVK